MNTLEKIVVVNYIIAALSFLIIYIYDWPLEVIGAIGISWVVSYSINVLYLYRKKEEKGGAEKAV